MFKRCIWCREEKGLKKVKKTFVCNNCSFIHTVNSAKAVAKMSDKEWEEFVARKNNYQ